MIRDIELKDLKKKIILFISHDNVEIFEGDSYYTVFDREQENKLNQDDNKRWEVYGKFVAEKLPKNQKRSEYCKLFSSIEAANNYIEENKLLYSKKDLFDVAYYAGVGNSNMIHKGVENWIKNNKK